jgi:hypothetical protein
MENMMDNFRYGTSANIHAVTPYIKLPELSQQDHRIYLKVLNLQLSFKLSTAHGTRKPVQTH